MIDTTPTDRINFIEGGNTLSIFNEAQTQSEILGSGVVDFSSNFTALKNLSDTLSGLAATLTPAGPGDLEFDFGLSAGLHVINLTASQLNLFGQTKNVGSLVSGARFLVNVDLTGFNGVLGQNINQNVPDSFASGILWNFFGNSDVKIKTKWVGSILAPEVTILDEFSNDIRGTVVAKGLTKASGQIHGGSFDYEFPEVKVPDSGSTLVLALLAIPAFLMIRRRSN
ncbi:hypothetical protein VDG1235_1460 [Verrucomicrobiia bacterium DG1235]|nr:hypothetical protein VDG1235_1460 [Verrucomicrobiae bacterium DG1235]